MRLTSFEFEGPFPDLDAVREQAGVYVVLSVRPGRAPVVLDVGESGYNVAQGGQGMQTRLRGHERRSCWEQHRGDGALVLAVLYEADGEIRLRVEKALRWDHRPPCGTDPWHIRRHGEEGGRMADTVPKVKVVEAQRFVLPDAEGRILARPERPVSSRRDP